MHQLLSNQLHSVTFSYIQHGVPVVYIRICLYIQIDFILLNIILFKKYLQNSGYYNIDLNPCCIFLPFLPDLSYFRLV